MKITISGDAGAGKSTVAKMIAEKLGLKRYYIGGLRRELAAKRGLSLEEYNKLGEKDPSTDREVDDYQRKIGQEEDDILVEGRTSYFLIPDSIKIYLTVNLEEGARRILNDLRDKARKNERNESKKEIRTLDEMKESIKKRRESDDKRYKKYYGKDIYDLSQYDIVVDTTHLTPQEVVDKIIKEIKRIKEIRPIGNKNKKQDE